MSEQEFYHADIKLKLCSSKVDRHEILDQEGFPLEKNKWFDFCDKVDETLPLLFYLNFCSFLLALPSPILIILGVIVESYRIFLYIGLGLIAAELVVDWFFSMIVTARVAKRVKEISIEALQDAYPTVTIELEDEPGNLFSWLCAAGDKYFVHVIVTTSHQV